jgi:hypothetical protein
LIYKNKLEKINCPSLPEHEQTETTRTKSKSKKNASEFKLGAQKVGGYVQLGNDDTSGQSFNGSYIYSANNSSSESTFVQPYENFLTEPAQHQCSAWSSESFCVHSSGLPTITHNNKILHFTIDEKLKLTKKEQESLQALSNGSNLEGVIQFHGSKVISLQIPQTKTILTATEIFKNSENEELIIFTDKPKRFLPKCFSNDVIITMCSSETLDLSEGINEHIKFNTSLKKSGSSDTTLSSSLSGASVYPLGESDDGELSHDGGYIFSSLKDKYEPELLSNEITGLIASIDTVNNSIINWNAFLRTNKSMVALLSLISWCGQVFQTLKGLPNSYNMDSNNSEQAMAEADICQTDRTILKQHVYIEEVLDNSLHRPTTPIPALAKFVEDPSNSTWLSNPQTTPKGSLFLNANACVFETKSKLNPKAQEFIPSWKK